MQLKSIKAYGFKSFADKIEIEVKDGITGIVGPNGSGKSNIVDAVKWVLGEQSVKALRGSSTMSDVIFQGSSTRKPQTRASVSLVFDNTDHYLNSEYDELEIKRIVYNTGDNEYSINNSKVRLKDITDLFLDTGAGKEAFSIISQGKIGEILNSKPEDRRAIIEEAAGVLKYKKRKLESLKKLDKTSDNLSKIELIINELLTTLNPLKIEAEKAKNFKNFKKELENIEIGLLIHDISNLNSEYEELKINHEKLKNEIETMESANIKDDTQLEKYKFEIVKFEQEIGIKNQKLLHITEEISSLEASKQVIIERKKYEVDDVKLADNILSLKENIMVLNNNLKKIDNEISENLKKLKEENNKKNDYVDECKKLIANKNTISSEINFKNKLISNIKNKIDIINSNLENDSFIPRSVKCILDNPRLKGISGTIGKLIEVPDEYSDAINTILGSNQNFLVTSNTASAKEAINYLKENKLGRATFFPLDVIKPKTIDVKILDMITENDNFIDIASNLVKFNKKYENIISNQLGNVIVVKDIDSMNLIGKKIKYSYRIVTLDGEILHTGGSLTGGNNKSERNTLTEKKALINLENELEICNKNLIYNNEKLKKVDIDILDIESKLNKIKASIIELEEINKNKIDIKNGIIINIGNKENELHGTENVKSSSLDNELEETLNKYYGKVNEKNLVENDLNNLKNKKSELSDIISEIELKARKFNSSYNARIANLKDIEVKLEKLDLKLDNMLLRLNDEYNITFEQAINLYEAPNDIELSRYKVQSLKKNIKDLGEVNTGAILEFDRINSRYEFLNEQKNDLQMSIDDLLKIINEMDETMETEFEITFNKVNSEFKNVFSKLFKGGHGELILTNKDNMLETGIDIIAEPPGKRLKNITLLSGGEKTLTAISLLFAILNVKVVPFCILDEVEAALDEANVDTFGTYLKEYEHKTQFIVITHKKKTMEYANTLYGITMQESGVSKLVSVRLENIKA